MRRPLTIFAAALALLAQACGGSAKGSASVSAVEPEVKAAPFSADSAYALVKAQVDFGPRVPGTQAHRRAGDWLLGRLAIVADTVIEQTAQLRAFDGTPLHMRNLFAQINPDAQDRTLLLAHWDTRPWADQDPDESRRHLPADGANDGASGVAVILETARQLRLAGSKKGVDILFVDDEDWGSEGDDASWALGAGYFTDHPPVDGYIPSRVVLLDMVGDRDAVFPREYFSQQAAPGLADEIWAAADAQGFASRFPNRLGGAVTDDHIKFIEKGIPAVDIIDYRRPQGFAPSWHTHADNLDRIDKATLQAVGRTLSAWLIL